MKKFTLVTDTAVKVEKFVPGGQTLGAITEGPDAGKKVFFWGALPGETVTAFTPTKIKSHYLEAVATAVAEPAPERVAPRDECYLSTSPWQILDFAAEQRAKAELVTESFRQQGITLPPLEIKTNGQEYFYRNKMEYALFFDHATQKIWPAFHQRGSHRKLPVQTSSLERPEIWQRAQEITQELNDRGAEARQFQSLMLRTNQKGEVSGGLFVNHQPHPQFDQLSDVLLGYTYSYSPNGFFQINLPVYALALEDMREFVTTERVLDLFSGVGTIGLSIARGRDLTLVECDRAAFAELEQNAASVASAQAVLARSEEALEYITPDATVILDPPRAGCAPDLVERLATVQPPTILYLSCNPVTQARDVARLLEATPYHIVRAGGYNFFPHTPHIENLVVLSTVL